MYQSKFCYTISPVLFSNNLNPPISHNLPIQILLCNQSSTIQSHFKSTLQSTLYQIKFCYAMSPVRVSVAIKSTQTPHLNTVPSFGSCLTPPSLHICRFIQGLTDNSLLGLLAAPLGSPSICFYVGSRSTPAL